MKPYETFASESKITVDRTTGVKVRQLTGWRGHSVHPYFTDEGWYADGKKMLFMSDRNNARNIYSIEIESGEISRLTDFPAVMPLPGDREDVHCSLDINKKRSEVYYRFGKEVFALNILTLETRLIYTIPEGFNFGGARPLACGDYIVSSLNEDLSKKVAANLSAGYVGMQDVFEAEQLCQIVRVHVETGEADIIWKEGCWVGHINPSPTQPHLITFCHEGPWHLVDNRIWVLDVNTGKATKIRERKQPGELIGHEYWFNDGVHIGYQCHSPQVGGDNERGVSWFGYVKYDGTGEVEADCAYPRNTPDHVHSIDDKIFCSDTGKAINIFRNNGGKFDGPRTLCMHDGSFFWGGHHPHPRITPDGKHVVFNSNKLGYCNIFMAEIPADFDSLPVS